MSGADFMFSVADGQAAARVLVVAEIGVNHDGQLDRGLALVQAAAEAGADAVKLQLFRPDRLLSDQALLAGYQKDKAPDLKALLAELALDLDAMGRLAEKAREAGLGFIVTPFSPGDSEDLAKLNVDAVKIASPDAVNTPLLQAVTALGKPILVSTGTCELEELTAVSHLISNHPAGGCLLQCVSSYPTPTEDAALGGMAALRERFGLPVGYSDHTRDPMTGALAVAAGAVLLEKHLTYDTQATGPDHLASADPRDFAEYVRQVRRAQSMVGPIRKQVLPVEADVRKVSRQSVCVLRDLSTGHRLTTGDLTVKRPGTGIPASEMEDIIGQTLICDVQANHLLMPEHIKRAEPARLIG
jgi:N,N'-diacetyllegionaminate synthase